MSKSPAPPSEPTEPGPTDILGLLPQAWHIPGTGYALLTCYRLVAMAPLERRYVLDVFDCRVVAQWGAIHSLDQQTVEFHAWTMLDFRVSGNTRSRTAQPGNLLICLAQLDSGSVEHEQDGRQRTAAAIGAALMGLGENAAHSLVCEQLIPPNGKPTETLMQVRTPQVFPDVEESRVDSMFGTLELLLRNADPATSTRIAHALRWLAQGMQADDTDAFVAMWISLEVLCLSGNTDVRPINELLARQYDVTYREACERFRVGRLHGIRSRIVHHGANVEIVVPIRQLLRAIFFDCVLAELGQRSDATQTVLKAPGTEVALADLMKRVCTRPFPVGNRAQRPCPCGNGERFADCHGGSDHSA